MSDLLCAHSESVGVNCVYVDICINLVGRGGVVKLGRSRINGMNQDNPANWPVINSNKCYTLQAMYVIQNNSTT